PHPTVGGVVHLDDDPCLTTVDGQDTVALLGTAECTAGAAGAGVLVPEASGNLLQHGVHLGLETAALERGDARSPGGRCGCGLLDLNRLGELVHLRGERQVV